ncbi:GNAT family N-acetyltransferase [Streptomyces mayonensis]|uniref:GNAT family N-acetyltransferase n=1 Tax=Streptomyces mayonensis TaxID=2750816 RepID=UPI001C1E3DB3|nr:GNAT family N-acetyltransferase [Streptomyces sp. A108]MBU6529685.1 GNAT family N-acetyltransferase [Streptomyces sp. A108]
MAESITVRDAQPADVEWMSDNTEGWKVTNKARDSGTSLEEAFHALVAERSDGTPAGWLHSIQRSGGFSEPGFVALYELHVSPDFRRQGIARALIDELFRRVPDQEIVLSAWDRDLYEAWLRLGFIYVADPSDNPEYRAYYGDMVRPPTTA